MILAKNENPCFSCPFCGGFNSQFYPSRCSHTPLLDLHSMHLSPQHGWLMKFPWCVTLSRWEGRLPRCSINLFCEDLCFSWAMIHRTPAWHWLTSRVFGCIRFTLEKGSTKHEPASTFTVNDIDCTILCRMETFLTLIACLVIARSLHFSILNLGWLSTIICSLICNRQNNICRMLVYDIFWLLW